MGRSWVDHPSWALVATASEASGRDVAHLLLQADADELRRTENAQLSTYVLSLVVHDAVRALGVRCSVAAGHSLGEYTALTATGALALEDGSDVGERLTRHVRLVEDADGAVTFLVGSEYRAEGASHLVTSHVSPLPGLRNGERIGPAARHG